MDSVTKIRNQNEGAVMLKKLIFTAFLACFALSANAQIATPQLDAGFHTYGGAAAGWRYGSTVSLTGLSSEGKVEYDGEEVGDVTSGLNGKGPEDSSTPAPFFLGAYRGETFAAELYSNLSDGLKTDIEMENVGGLSKYNIYNEKKESRVNLAYVIGESISVGFGYYTVTNKEKSEQEATGFEATAEEEIKETGISLTASVRLADIFFVAAGMESVSQKGTYESSSTITGLGTTAADQDYVDNSWNNMMWGAGAVVGDPGDTQFRVEVGQIISPESEEEADSGSTSEITSSHPQTTTTFVSAEARFGEFLFGVLSENEKEKELNDSESESTTTSAGLGWQPMEGLTLSLYALNHKITQTDTANDIDFVINPTGYRFFVGYNF